MLNARIHLNDLLISTTQFNIGFAYRLCPLENNELSLACYMRKDIRQVFSSFSHLNKNICKFS